MVTINQYETCGKRIGDFVSNGFSNMNGYVSRTTYLYETSIILILCIGDDMIMPNVRCDDGDYYTPFYNPDLRHHNLVFDEVARNYNKFMDSLVDKGLLRRKEDKKVTNDFIIKIKYHNPELEKLKYIDGKSDWIDLRAAEDVTMKKGDFKLISLGISMKIPYGYEAHIVPRSSTFKNFGIIQTNSIGIIDNSYSGDQDIWKFPAYAIRDTEIHKNDRICQFRIIENQPRIIFNEVDKLSDESRGGFGSTGKN